MRFVLQYDIIILKANLKVFQNAKEKTGQLRGAYLMKIAMIIPEDLMGVAREVTKNCNKTITIFNSTLKAGDTIAKELETKGYDVIITRGGIQLFLSGIGLNIPTVSITVNALDIYQAVCEAENIDKDVSIMAFKNMIPACNTYVKISGKATKIIQIEDEREVKSKLEELVDMNKKVIVCGATIKNYALTYNITPIVIKSGEQAFISAIEEAIRIVQAIRKEKESKEKIKAIIENTQDGIIFINNRGTIERVNKFAEKILKLKRKELLWKNIKDILPELELDKTINTGIKETDIITDIRDIKFIVSKIPIKIKEETIDVIIIIKDIDEIHKLEEKIRKDIVKSGNYAKYTFADIVGISDKIKEIIGVSKEFAKVDSTILIEGETGTGKEVFAQSIHNYSKRANGPFVAVNCAAIPQNLLESELFGYASGSFTGADKKGKRGLFEVAQDGTIFLDEISEMNPMLQSTLLRVLQEKQIMRIGSNMQIPINARVIAATNKDLRKLVEEGKFRKDLFYRLNILRIVITPIRDRREDIVFLMNHFIKMHCKALEKEKLTLSEEVKKYLIEYNWPGNVREIKNFAERLCVIAKKQNIQIEDIQNKIFYLEDKNINNREKEVVEDFFELEKEMIKCAIKKTHGNLSKAAVELGISRTTLWRKMKKYNIIVKV